METLLSKEIVGSETATAVFDVILEKVLSTRSRYRPSDDEVRYSAMEQNIAMNLALESMGKLSIVPIRSRDLKWETDGGSVVRRYILEDGSAAYFKPFAENSRDETFFQDYGTSSLGAAISELNAHRMAKLLGPAYAELVPETVLREIEGSLGTLQREAVQDPKVGKSYRKSIELMEDYRRASLFDFVIGNLDRHSDNFIYGIEGRGDQKRARIRLIDNSFGFPATVRSTMLNESIFADNLPADGYSSNSYTIPSSSLGLTEDEREALELAAEGVEQWIAAKTIAIRRGRATIKRIRFLLKQGKLGGFEDYLFGA